MKKVNTQCTSNAVCPYCGYRRLEATKYRRYLLNANYVVITCEDCERRIKLICDDDRVDVTHDTEGAIKTPVQRHSGKNHGTSG